MEACLRTLCDPQEISAELKDLINGMLQCASTLAPPHPLHMCVCVRVAYNSHRARALGYNP